MAGNLDVFTAAAASLIFLPFYTNHMANLADGPPCINNKSPAVIYLGQHAGEGFGKNLQLGDAPLKMKHLSVFDIATAFVIVIFKK